jgi:hypothetical protein
VSAQLPTGPRYASLQDIVRELRDKGWIVEIEPSRVSLPDSLRGLPVDLVARLGDRLLVGEVVSRRSARAEKIDVIARRVKEIPNAELEVFWLGDASEQAPPLGDVLSYVREARAALDAAPSAAFLVAWVALEGGIVRFAEQADKLGGWNTPRQLFAYIYSLGLINESDFDRISNLWRVRNDMAHHTTKASVAKDDIRYVLDLAERLAAGRYVTVDQMVEWFLDNYEDRAAGAKDRAAGDRIEYADDGSLDASEVLSSTFRDAARNDVRQAAELLEQMGSAWVRKSVD